MILPFIKKKYWIEKAFFFYCQCKCSAVSGNPGAYDICAKMEQLDLAQVFVVKWIPDHL